MATLRFTDADRDDRGFVTVPAPAPAPAEPRALVDLLPSPVAETTRLAPQPPAAKRAPMLISGAVAVLAIVLAVRFGSGGDARPAAPPRPATTAQASGDRTPMPSPIPATIPAAPLRLLVAFAAPDGQPLGAIESTRAITPTAHYGQDWIQADVAGSGLVWLRASDAPELPIVGPDLAPRPTATARPYVRPTEPPPPPTQCAEAGIPGKMVSSCGYDDLGTLQALAQQQWLATYGGNPGIIMTPTPADWSRP